MKSFEYFTLSIIVVASIFMGGHAVYQSVFSEISTENVLIIDAGHGGLDGGAVSINGVAEDEITLSISLKTADICSFLGIPYELTRINSQSLDYNENASIRENKVNDTRKRVEIVNNYSNGLLVSIHLNNYSTSQPSGAQIFYNEDALQFAENLQSSISDNIDKNNTRTVQKYPETVYLIKNSKLPAIIYECGFLSNPNDEMLLQNNDYQTKLALVLVTTYQTYIRGSLNENNIFMQ